MEKTTKKKYAHGSSRAWGKGVITKDVRIKARNRGCEFCHVTGMVDETLTCANCGTTSPKNYGSNQRVDKHGKSVVSQE